MSTIEGHESTGYHGIVWPLAVAQTLIWAFIYYSFPALILHFESDLGWGRTTVAGAFTLALLLSALLAPYSGRLIDKGMGKQLLVGSGLASAVLLALLSQVTAVWQFYAVWLALGAAMACGLYETCFAFLTRHMGEDNKRSITHVALVAGFAGTVSFPLSNLLAGSIGWRDTVLVFATVLVVVQVPLSWFAGQRAEQRAPAGGVDGQSHSAHAREVIASGAFWLLAISFTCVAFNHGLLITHLLPLLAEKGVATSLAVLAASMIGPMQVLGRIVVAAFGARASSAVTLYACFVGMIVGAITLYFADAGLVPIAIFVALHGAGYGVTSIIRPVITAELLGRANFGVIAGALAVPYMLGFAIAPTIASVIWQFSGYDLVIVVAGLCSVLGIVTLRMAIGKT
ncbi:MAG: MFS transporter [Pseudomonadota bacterium]